MVRHPGWNNGGKFETDAGQAVNTYKPALLLARKSLIALGVVVALCVAVVVCAAQLADSSQASLIQSRGALQNQQVLLQTQQSDLDSLRQHMEHYVQLRAKGLVGEPDRALWVEQLQDSYRRAQLPEGLVVQLLPPKPLAASTAAGLSTSSMNPVNPGSSIGTLGEAPGSVPSGPLVHDLQFELHNVVESEVLELLNDYQATVKGRMRVNSCKLSEPQSAGLSVQCVLRFISITALPAQPL